MPDASADARVGIVFVSHSRKLAEGLVELARQMAPTARLEAAGGTDDGRIGTSFDLVSSAIQAADGGAGVAVLCDLGSAILTAPMPGRVIGVRANTGERVTAHQAIVIIEAMKMEHAVVAPMDGELVALHVAEGQQVGRGDLLAEVGEPAS